MFVPVGHDQTFGEIDPEREARDQPPRRRLPQAGGGAEGMSGEPLALYVHWPFCVSKCPYCDFNSHVRVDDRPGRVARGAARRPRARGAAAARPDADLDLLRRRHAVADGPRDGRGGDRRRARRTGRQPTTSRSRSRPIPIRSRRRASPISPRPASTACRSACRASTTQALAFLGRAHSAREGFARARNRAEALPPRQLRPDLRASRRHRGRAGRRRSPRRCRSAPAHLSLYQLTIEPGTRFAAHGRRSASSSRSTPTRPRRSTS